MADPTRLSNRRSPLRTVVTVVLIAAALTAMMANFESIGLSTFAIFCLVSLCFAAAHRITGALVLRFSRRRPLAVPYRALLSGAGILTAAVVGGEAATRVLLAFGWTHAADLARLRVRVVSIGLAVLIGIRLVELGYERLRGQIRSVELREERARRQALHAELAALQARTDPHFLFNSLNTIAGLIEEDPKRAVAVVNRLSSLFRHAVQSSRVESVLLRDEIEAVSAFLEIQALRFADAVSWTVEVAPGLEAARIPPLILQPLVENAVLHGASKHRQTRVGIDARVDGERLLLTVSDNGPGPGLSTHRGSGTSLADLNERLSLLFGSAGGLETGPAPGGGFRARLRLPLAAGPQPALERSSPVVEAT